MATLNEIAYSIFEKLRPEISDDDAVSLRQIKFDVQNYRALFLRNELNKNRTIDSDVEQTLCVDLEEVNPSDCCVEVGCSLILRSTKTLPKTIEMHNKQAITRVGPVDKTTKPFSFVDYSRVPYVGSGRYNKHNVYSFLHDGYVYLTSNDKKVNFLKKAVVRGVFEDPEEVANYTDCNTGEPCYTDNSEYPIKGWMIPSIEEAILQKYLPTIQLPEDNSNDSKSNPNPVD